MALLRSPRLFVAGLVVAGAVGALVWKACRSGSNSGDLRAFTSQAVPPAAVAETTDYRPLGRPLPSLTLVATGLDSEGPFTDAGLEAEAKSRALRSGPEAMAWARAQTDPAKRERFVSAALRAWAEVNPKAAIDWLRQHDEFGEKAWESAFIGAAQRPTLLLEAAQSLLAVDPAQGASRGAILLAALASIGQYKTAAEFAREAPPEFRDDWIKAAYRRWSGDKPEEAALAINALGNDFSREIAFPALVEGWASKSPAGLAAYAITLPEGDSRGQALGQALLKWCEQDPSALATWLANIKSPAEYDLGAMLLVTQTDRANRSTDLALRWTESIGDPQLKRESFQHVLTEWLQTDPRAARAYVEQATWLNPGERSSFLQAASASPPEEP